MIDPKYFATPEYTRRFAMHDRYGKIENIGTMALGHLEDKIANGEPYILLRNNELPVLGEHRVNLNTGRIIKLTEIEKSNEVTAVQLSDEQFRALRYPPITEFIEAFTEREMGRPAKWVEYMEKVKAIHDLPKEKK